MDPVSDYNTKNLKHESPQATVHAVEATPKTPQFWDNNGGAHSHQKANIFRSTPKQNLQENHHPNGESFNQGQAGSAQDDVIVSATSVKNISGLHNNETVFKASTKWAVADDEEEEVPSENSPKTAQLKSQQSSVDSEQEGDIYARVADCSADSQCDDFGEWEVVDETVIAVDYSNVHVFNKTLQEWRKKNSQQSPSHGKELKVNLDESLCQKVFSCDDPSLSQAQIADYLFQSGFISLDSAPIEAAGTKKTWYKTEVEPCVGTTLFLEVPLCRVSQPPQQPSASPSLNKGRGRSRSLQKRTLVVNPKTSSSTQLKRLHSQALLEEGSDDLQSSKKGDDDIEQDRNGEGGNDDSSSHDIMGKSLEQQQSKRRRTLPPTAEQEEEQGVQQRSSGADNQLAYLGMNEYQLSLKSKVWHSTSSIRPAPQLAMVRGAAPIVDDNERKSSQRPALSSASRGQRHQAAGPIMALAAERNIFVRGDGDGYTTPMKKRDLQQRVKVTPGKLELQDASPAGASRQATETKIKVERLFMAEGKKS